MYESDNIKEIISFIIAFVGISTLLFGIIQFRKNILFKRTEQFFELRRLFIQNPSIVELVQLLDDNDENIKDIPYSDKLTFLGIIEEIALLVNSKLLKKEIAWYMFGFFAIRASENKNFWLYKKKNGDEYADLNKNSIYWQLYNNFVSEMKKLEEKNEYNNSVMKFQ